MKTLKPLVCLLLVLNVSLANAAGIFSECPVLQSDSPNNKDAIDRFRPDPSQLVARGFSKNFAEMIYYVAWLFNSRLPPKDQIAAQNNLHSVVEDVQMTMVLNDPENACHSASNPKTIPLEIIPFALREKGSDGKHLVRFKACEYMVDSERQLQFDEACKVIGREGGYSYSEMKNRYEVLRSNLKTVREGTKYAAAGIGLVVMATLFRVSRGVGAPFIGSALFATLPTGLLAFYTMQNGLLDELARDEINFQNAVEVPLTGDQTTTIKIARPMQEFFPYFERYLDSIDNNDKTAKPL